MNPPVKAFHRDVLASKTTHGLLQPFGRLHRAKSSQFIPGKPSTLLLFIIDLDFPSRRESRDSCKPCHQNGEHFPCGSKDKRVFSKPQVKTKLWHMLIFEKTEYHIAIDIAVTACISLVSFSTVT